MQGNRRKERSREPGENERGLPHAWEGGELCPFVIDSDLAVGKDYVTEMKDTDVVVSHLRHVFDSLHDSILPCRLNIIELGWIMQVIG